MPIEKIEPGAPESQSADVAADNLAQLRKLFPELVTEGKTGPAINVDVLKALVGDATVTDADEKYGLNWHGKRAARQLALTPSAGTLRPCPDESVDWDTTQNLMIEGDNLEVLKLLQKSYAGKVKLIYIDPPYNTGKDFVYPDNFHDSLQNYRELTGQTEGGRRITSNTETSGRFHTDWLSMIYPRLHLAKNLLDEDGVIFISIDDGELGNILSLMNELFGEENFRANISWQKRYTRSNNTIDFTTVVEHIVVFSKSDLFSVNLLERTQEADARYTNPDNDPRGPWKGASILNPATPQQRPNLCYPIVNPITGQKTLPTKNAWRRSKSDFDRLTAEGRLYWGSNGDQPLPSIKMFLSEARNITPINFWDHNYAGNTDDGTRDLRDLLGEKKFDNPKPVQLLKRVLEHATSKDSLIVDFFAGSGTTAQAVLDQNMSDGGTRRFILVQLPEPLSGAESAGWTSIADITRARITAAGERHRKADPMFPGDVGFRTFRLDTSNIRAWSPQPQALAQSLFDHLDHIHPDRSDEDLLYELLLKLGLDLCTPIDQKVIADKMVYSVGGGVLIACLEPQITPADAEPLALGIVAWHRAQQTVGEVSCVFLDSAFENDVAKTNLAAILEQHGIAKVRSV